MTGQILPFTVVKGGRQPEPSAYYPGSERFFECLGVVFRMIREQDRKWSLAEASRQTGIDARTIARVEAVKTSCTRSYLRYANALGRDEVFRLASRLTALRAGYE